MNVDRRGVRHCARLMVVALVRALGGPTAAMTALSEVVAMAQDAIYTVPVTARQSLDAVGKAPHAGFTAHD